MGQPLLLSVKGAQQQSDWKLPAGPPHWMILPLSPTQAPSIPVNICCQWFCPGPSVDISQDLLILIEFCQPKLLLHNTECKTSIFVILAVGLW